MPTDSSGTSYATQICQTQLEYNASGTLATSTEYCYKQNDIYYQDTIDLFIIVCVFVGIIWAIRKL